MGAVAGVDWASEHNDLRISGPSGQQILELRLAGDEAGIARLVALCVEHEVEVVGIERPEGLLVDRLLEAGLCVLTPLRRISPHLLTETPQVSTGWPGERSG